MLLQEFPDLVGSSIPLIARRPFMFAAVNEHSPQLHTIVRVFVRLNEGLALFVHAGLGISSNRLHPEVLNIVLGLEIRNDEAANIARRLDTIDWNNGIRS